MEIHGEDAGKGAGNKGADKNVEGDLALEDFINIRFLLA
jgi:hypothetical protein